MVFRSRVVQDAKRFAQARDIVGKIRGAIGSAVCFEGPLTEKDSTKRDGERLRINEEREVS